MSVYRIRKDKDNPYVMVNKHFINDTLLSFKAKGILLYLLSRPDDWQVYEIEIMKHAKDGRDSVRAGIKELIKAGYIVRGQRRQEKGKFAGYDYEVFEVPHRVGKPDNGKPDNGKSNTTNKVSKLSNNGNQILYISLPTNDVYLKIYSYLFKRNMGKEHPRVTQEQVERIERCIEYLKCCDVDEDLWQEEIQNHFNRLPKTNNGNILAFLKASMRYFDVDLQDEIQAG